MRGSVSGWTPRGVTLGIEKYFPRLELGLGFFSRSRSLADLDD